MELIKALAFQLDQPFISFNHSHMIPLLKIIGWLFRIALIYDLIDFWVILLHVATNAQHLDNDLI
jgi:hypothetical protein